MKHKYELNESIPLAFVGQAGCGKTFEAKALMLQFFFEEHRHIFIIGEDFEYGDMVLKTNGSGTGISLLRNPADEPAIVIDPEKNYSVAPSEIDPKTDGGFLYFEKLSAADGISLLIPDSDEDIIFAIDKVAELAAENKDKKFVLLLDAETRNKSREKLIQANGDNLFCVMTAQNAAGQLPKTRADYNIIPLP